MWDPASYLYLAPITSMLLNANRSYYFYYKKAMANICSTCGKTFKHGSSLSRHRTNVHKDKEFKCDVCQQLFSSKCSLDRHRRVKHNKSDFSKFEYVKKEDESSDNEVNTDKESEGDVESDDNNNIDSKKIKYTNKEDIDNNNNGQEESDSVNSMDAETSDNIVNDYKHDLFDIVANCKEMCDRFKYCLSFATFRIHPPPVPISSFKLYAKWLDNVFGGILEYFAPKYSPDLEDFVSLNIFQVDTRKSIWIGPIKRKELNVTYVVSKILKEKLTNPSGDLTVGLNCVKSKVTCPTCGHTKVCKDGVSYTD